MKNIQKQPLLSICIPTYNRPKLLKRTLQSLKNDFIGEVEIIVTDNSENDETKEMVNAFFANYNGEWRYNKNNFPSDMPGFHKMTENFNMGVKLAKGKYIYIIHDDDFILKDKIKVMLQRLKELEDRYHVIVFGLQLVDIKENVIKKHFFSKAGYYEPDIALELLLKNSSSIRFPSVLISQEAYKKIGLWDKEAQGPTDYNMWIRSFSEYGVYMLSDVLAAYTIHQDSMTMKTFNEQNIQTLLNLFKIVESKNILSGHKINKLKALFFHQFILAGAYKFISRKLFIEANKVMKLFQMKDIRNLPIPLKWMPVRFGFSLILIFTNLVR